MRRLLIALAAAGGLITLLAVLILLPGAPGQGPAGGGSSGVEELAHEENFTVMENGDALLQCSSVVATPAIQEVYGRTIENLGERTFMDLFSRGVRMEHMAMNGIDAEVVRVDLSRDRDNVLRILVEASAPLASRFNPAENIWEMNLGPRMENRMEGAGFVLMQMMFSQMMLRSIPGEQTFEYTSSLPIRLPAGAVLFNSGELSGRRWRVDFGGGNYREAALSVVGQNELLLTERVVVTENPPAPMDEKVFSALRDYRSFTVKYTMAGQEAPPQGKSAEEVSSDADFSWELGSSVSCPFDVTLASGTFSYGGSSVSAEVGLSGSADLGFSWYIGWDFAWEWTGFWWEYRLQWFKAYVEIDSSVEIRANAASGELSHEWSHDIYAWSHPLVTFIGPVPVVVEVRLDVDGGVELGVSGELDLNAGADASAEYRAGVQWTRSKGWEPIAEQHYSLVPVGPEISASASASVTPYLQLKLGAYFYYTAGPFVGFKPLATATLTPDPENWLLEAGFDVDAGVGFGSISEWIDLPEWSVTLYSWRIPIAAGKGIALPENFYEAETDGAYSVYPVDVAGEGDHFIAIGRRGAEPDRLYLFSKGENKRLWYKDHVWTAAISPDGSYVIAGGATYFNPRISLLNSSGEELWSYDVGSYPAPVDISRNARTVAAVGSSGGETVLYVFSGSYPTPIHQFSLGSGGAVKMVRVSANGDYIAAYVQDDELRRLFVFYRDSPVPIWTYDLGDFGSVFSLDISGDGTYVVAGGVLAGFNSMGVYLFSRLDNVPVWVFRTPGESISEVALSGGRYLVVGSYREVTSERRFVGKVRLFSTEDNRPLWTYHVPDAVFAVGISGDGRWVCAGTSGGDLYKFLGETGEPLWKYETSGFGGVERQIGVFPDGYVVAGGGGGKVHLFEP
jgi:outer membrane protein assembly factor BamB